MVHQCWGHILSAPVGLAEDLRGGKEAAKANVQELVGELMLEK